MTPVGTSNVLSLHGKGGILPSRVDGTIKATHTARTVKEKAHPGDNMYLVPGKVFEF